MADKEDETTVSFLKKIALALKKIPSLYYNWRKRNEELSAFLETYKDQREKLNHIDSSVSELTEDVLHIKEKITELDEQITQINGRVEAIGTGTKMELFDTLHNLYQLYVIKRGYSTVSEKKEVETLYTLYHKHLEGNGLGTRYYNEIIALPDSEEELKRKCQGGCA